MINNLNINNWNVLITTLVYLSEVIDFNYNFLSKRLIEDLKIG